MVGTRKLIPLIYLLVGASGCQLIAPTDDQSLASIMAEMEVHMNQLYRSVGDEALVEETRKEAEVLLGLQQRALRFVRNWRVEGQSQLVFQMEDSVRLNESFLKILESGNSLTAREALDRMDRARRRCHSDFG